ncbi:MAG: DsrH/TusB family sulfur metabolism protein [Candidatus Nezhaarchaeota archaeon]|nr:DsrH/TusB family sulfur metabolism protein [Candidatus Nezhaarchaeota archaeon]
MRRGMVLLLVLSPPSSLLNSHAFRVLVEGAEAAYLASSGVYAAVEGGPVSGEIARLARRGVVYVSREDLLERGVKLDMLIDGVKMPRNFYLAFVEHAFKSGKVVVL